MVGKIWLQQNLNMNKIKKKYKEGGKPLQATTQDSLDLYNNAKQVEDYYNNKKKYIKKKEGPFTGNLSDKLDSDFQQFQLYNQHGIITPTSKNLPIEESQYRQVIDANKLKQREAASTILDTRSPMQLFDRRVNPQTRTVYENNVPGEKLVGDQVDLYKYDPVAIKPVAMLSPEERKIREQKYPNSFGNAVTRKPIFTPKAVPTVPPLEIQNDSLFPEIIRLREAQEKDIPSLPENVGPQGHFFKDEYLGKVKIDGKEQFKYGGNLMKTINKKIRPSIPGEAQIKGIRKAAEGVDLPDSNFNNDKPMYSVPQRNSMFDVNNNENLTNGSVPQPMPNPDGNPQDRRDMLTGMDTVAVHPNMNDSRFNNPNSHSDMKFQSMQDPTTTSTANSKDPKFKMKFSGKPNPSGGINTSDLFTGALGLISSLLPDTPIQNNQQTLRDAYNPNPNGTGSQAIFEEGGKVIAKNGIRSISLEDAAISKVLMERNRGKNFVDRAFSNDTAPRLQTNGIPGYQNMPDNQYSTELMAYDTNNDGTGRVYPEIVQRPGQQNLEYLGGDKAYNYANNTGEYIQTPSWKTADMFSSYGYKHASGTPIQQFGGRIEYEEGQEYDLDDKEIARLKSLGYKIKIK